MFTKEFDFNIETMPKKLSKLFGGKFKVRYKMVHDQMFTLYESDFNIETMPKKCQTVWS
jgi:hypothetical protein